MISLNDAQLKPVMAAAARVPHEKRARFLERIFAMLRVTDGDVDDVIGLALVGLVHERAA